MVDWFEISYLEIGFSLVLFPFDIGGGAIFFGREGGSGGETKIAEGIRDAKNRRFVLYIAFAGKSGEATAPLPPPPPRLRRPSLSNVFHFARPLQTASSIAKQSFEI